MSGAQGLEPNKPILIVTAAFNCEKYIDETIQSVLAQTIRNWIHVIVDDGSKDGTWQILERYAAQDPRIRIHRREKSGGRPSIPRNSGTRFAMEQGIDFDHVSYIDHDDLWLPHKLENQLKVMAADPAVGLVYSGKLVQFFEDGTRKTVQRRLIKNARELCLHSHISLSTVLIKRAAIEKDLPTVFDEDADLLAVEDLECWFRLLGRGVKFGKTEQEEVLYRVIGTSASSVQKGKRFRRLFCAYSKAAIRNPELPVAWVYFTLMLKGLKIWILG